MFRLAGLYTFQGVDVINISAFEQLRQWELSGEAGIDAQLEQDAIRIKIPGPYFVMASLSFHGEANVTYYAEIRHNGGRIAGGLVCAQEVTTADKPFNMVVVGAGYFDEGDLVSVYVGSDEVGGANFQLIYGQFGAMSW